MQFITSFNINDEFFKNEDVSVDNEALAGAVDAISHSISEGDYTQGESEEIFLGSQVIGVWRVTNV